ncbi:hypothetical protein BH09SUM1_BH09SUM1_24250 [soil metagenome]
MFADLLDFFADEGYWFFPLCFLIAVGIAAVKERRRVASWWVAWRAARIKKSESKHDQRLERARQSVRNKNASPPEISSRGDRAARTRFLESFLTGEISDAQAGRVASIKAEKAAPATATSPLARNRSGAEPEMFVGNSSLSGLVAAQPIASVPEKSWIVTLALCVFMGHIGAHRFYAGRVMSGLFMLVQPLLAISGVLLGLSISPGFLVAAILLAGFGICLWLFDIAAILLGLFSDSYGRPLKDGPFLYPMPQREVRLRAFAASGFAMALTLVFISGGIFWYTKYRVV